MPANRANIGWYIEEQLTDLDGKVAGKIYEKQVTVSSAEILALNTTAKELVPAPGADRVLEFISATIKHNAGTAYVEADAPDDCYIRYSGGQACSADIDSTNFLDQTDDEIRIIPFSVSTMAITVDLEALKNTALQLYNPDSNLTTGTGTLDIRVTYRIHKFD
jgi:hypothetical protein